MVNNLLKGDIKFNEKKALYCPKPWALYCNGEFVWSYPSHAEAKRALHRKCELMKKYPYDYADDYYTIQPYKRG